VGRGAGGSLGIVANTVATIPGRWFVARDVAGARVDGRRAGVRFRRPALPWVGRPRKLTPEEAAALSARPWPRLPWWLWLAATVAVIGLTVAAAGLLSQSAEPPPRLGERRTPPGGGLTHDLGAWRAPALAPAAPGAPDRFVRVTATCPRLAGLTLAGSPSQVDVLRLATDDVCALRSVGGIDRARTGLRDAGAVVAFATYERSGNESSTLLAPPPGGQLALGDARVAVLLNAKFEGGKDPAVAAKRIAVLLVHEGAHLAAGTGPPTAEGELAARRAELDACDRLFPEGAPGPKANRGCQDARELLRLGDAGALAELRASGYR
jgi:hypothetical protein